MEVAADAELLQLHLTRSKKFAGSADRVIGRMIEIGHVINVRANFGSEELRVPKNILGPRISVQPSPVRIREGLDFLWCSVGRSHGRRRDLARCTRRALRRCRGSGRSSRSRRRCVRDCGCPCCSVRRRSFLRVGDLQFRFQLIDALAHGIEFFHDFGGHLLAGRCCLLCRQGLRCPHFPKGSGRGPSTETSLPLPPQSRPARAALLVWSLGFTSFALIPGCSSRVYFRL